MLVSGAVTEVNRFATAGARCTLRATKRIAGALAALALAGTITSMTAGVAIAEPKAEHVVGEQCIGADIGRQDVASSGQAIICDSNYHWEPYVGQTQMIPGSPPKTPNPPASACSPSWCILLCLTNPSTSTRDIVPQRPNAVSAHHREPVGGLRRKLPGAATPERADTY